MTITLATESIRLFIFLPAKEQQRMNLIKFYRNSSFKIPD